MTSAFQAKLAKLGGRVGVGWLFYLKKIFQRKTWKVLSCHFWKNKQIRYTRQTHISQLWNKGKYPQSGRYTIPERPHVVSLASWWNCRLCLLLLLLFKIIVSANTHPGTYPRPLNQQFLKALPEIILGFYSFCRGYATRRSLFFLCFKRKSPGFSTETLMTSFATTATTSATVCPCWGSQCDGDGDDE